MIIYLQFEYVSNYIPLNPPKVKAGIHLKVFANQDNGLQKQDLGQWMNENEKK